MDVSLFPQTTGCNAPEIQKQDSSVPRHTIYQMARLFSLASAVIAGNIIHDYTAVLYVHGRMNSTKFLNIVSLRSPWSHMTYMLIITFRQTLIHNN